MDSWTWEPGLCLHCFRAVDTDNNVAKGMYCSRVCQDQAEKVRYVRRTIRDGRLADPWVATTLCTNHIPFLALDLGYVRPPVTGPLRAEVLGRNEGLCAECLAAPATEVDHISGGSNDPDNLRGLCHPCHEAKPRGAIPSDLTRDGEGTIDRSEASRELAHRWQAVLSREPPLAQRRTGKSYGNLLRDTKRLGSAGCHSRCSPIPQSPQDTTMRTGKKLGQNTESLLRSTWLPEEQCPRPLRRSPLAHA